MDRQKQSDILPTAELDMRLMDSSLAENRELLEDFNSSVALHGVDFQLFDRDTIESNQTLNIKLLKELGVDDRPTEGSKIFETPPELTIEVVGDESSELRDLYSQTAYHRVKTRSSNGRDESGVIVKIERVNMNHYDMGDIKSARLMTEAEFSADIEKHTGRTNLGNKKFDTFIEDLSVSEPIDFNRSVAQIEDPDLSLSDAERKFKTIEMIKYLDTDMQSPDAILQLYTMSPDKLEEARNNAREKSEAFEALIQKMTDISEAREAHLDGLLPPKNIILGRGRNGDDVARAANAKSEYVRLLEEKVLGDKTTLPEQKVTAFELERRERSKGILNRFDIRKRAAARGRFMTSATLTAAFTALGPTAYERVQSVETKGVVPYVAAVAIGGLTSIAREKYARSRARKARDRISDTDSNPIEPKDIGLEREVVEQEAIKARQEDDALLGV